MLLMPRCYPRDQNPCASGTSPVPVKKLSGEHNTLASAWLFTGFPRKHACSSSGMHGLADD